MERERKLTLDELCRLLDLPKRTVRYYIQQGVLDRPEGVSRGAYYTQRHVEQLLAIRKWRRAGLSLERIGELLERDGRGPLPPETPRPKPGEVEVWSRLLVARGVELHLEPRETGFTPEEFKRFARGVMELYRRIVAEREEEP